MRATLAALLRAARGCEAWTFGFVEAVPYAEVMRLGGRGPER
jgi:hypothetical protein